MARTIYRHYLNHIRVTLMHEGKPLSLRDTDEVRYAVLTRSGKMFDGRWNEPHASDDGADWASGKVVVSLDLTQQSEDWDKLNSALLVIRSPYGQYVEELDILHQAELMRSQLFIKDLIVPDLRRNQLLVAASGAMREVPLTDDYIWQKLRAAESEVAHTLRILLTPHQVFPQEPTQDEIDALDGMPYLVETPYDYSPNMYDRDKWGYFMTRQRPIISVQRLRFKLPSQDSQFFDIPLEWLKLDEKYGHVRLLPTTNASLVTSSLLGFTALTWQSIIPNMLNLTYQAGIKDAHADYPELIDAIKKMAVVKILTDLFLPQSGSISADGLSESMSTDVAKYQEQIDHIMNGQDGNGGLMALFNGIRAIVI
ncbi:hypothetical protein B5K64_003538 [Escherichia coli]|nr:hypothetical protein [Escherichia coli]